MGTRTSSVPDLQDTCRVREWPMFLASRMQPGRQQRLFLVTRQKAHVSFCSIFVHPLFPVVEPHIQKGVIFVRRRPCVRRQCSANMQAEGPKVGF